MSEESASIESIEEKKATVTETAGVNSPSASNPTFSRQDTVFSTTSSTSPAQPAHGYPALAHLVGHEPGFAIFRRFGALNAKLLLYMQAELVQLEQELSDLEHSNSTYSSTPPSLQHNVSTLMHAPPNTPAAKQWSLIQHLNSKIRDYNKLILEHEQLYKLPPPSPSEFENLWNFLHGPDTGGNWLQHPESSIWATDPTTGKAIAPDLVALSSPPFPTDPFTTWFFQRFHPWLHSHLPSFLLPATSPDGSYEYSDASLNRFVNNVITVISSLLPTASIFALYYIRSTTWRLVFILGFGVVFSGALAVFTGARRVEVFAAAVALASVQVVFVGINVQ
ncbi:MAG: hypothetical protein Q9227_000924 [Pyrenula ochraceoflavens]